MLGKLGILATSVVLMTVGTAAATPLPAAALHQNTQKARATGAQTARARKLVQPAPLDMSVLESYLSTIAGRPITISCDTPGIPGTDGYTMGLGDDGEVFWDTSPDGTYMIAPIVHVWTAECYQAQRANREREPSPTGFLTYKDQRVDSVSGAAFSTLLHETMHVTLQSGDEALVECTAVQNAWALVRQLDLPTWEAHMMLAAMAWRHAASAPQYLLDC